MLRREIYLYRVFQIAFGASGLGTQTTSHQTLPCISPQFKPECIEDHGEEDELAKEGNNKRGWGDDLGEEEEEHREGKQDGDGQRDLDDHDECDDDDHDSSDDGAGGEGKLVGDGERYLAQDEQQNQEKNDGEQME